MRIELLHSLLDKGTIDDETIILVEIPYVVEGVPHMMTYGVSGCSIEHAADPRNVKLILKASKCLPSKPESLDISENAE